MHTAQLEYKPGHTDSCPFIAIGKQTNKGKVEIQAQRKNPHCWLGGQTHLLLNIMKDLNIIGFLDMRKYHNTSLF